MYIDSLVRETVMRASKSLKALIVESNPTRASRNTRKHDGQKQKTAEAVQHYTETEFISVPDHLRMFCISFSVCESVRIISIRFG